MTFNLNKISVQPERVAVVTGANVGLGYETAKVLAEKEFTVILACRNLDKANKAISRIKKLNPQAKLQSLRLDLCSNKSVLEFATAFAQNYDRLDLFINNAGDWI